jgi:ferrous iron transport protein B
VTHKFWGMLIFVAVMALMFLSIFTFAQWPMDLLSACSSGGDLVHNMPGGDLESLLEKGVILGVGAVVAFLPQICLLFLFIGLLEDTGYMARAAFLMDRLMSKVGLHGKSFIPMLSSFACAIPGIMATRTIETPKGPAGHDPGGAVDELFGAAAGLHAAHRGVHHRRCGCKV